MVSQVMTSRDHLSINGSQQNEIERCAAVERPELRLPAIFVGAAPARCSDEKMVEITDRLLVIDSLDLECTFHRTSQKRPAQLACPAAVGRERLDTTKKETSQFSRLATIGRSIVNQHLRRSHVPFRHRLAQR